MSLRCFAASLCLLHCRLLALLELVRQLGGQRSEERGPDLEVIGHALLCRLDGAGLHSVREFQEVLLFAEQQRLYVVVGLLLALRLFVDRCSSSSVFSC